MPAEGDQGGPDVGTGDGGTQDPGAQLDVIDPTGEQVDFIKHGWNRLLLKLLLQPVPLLVPLPMSLPLIMPLKLPFLYLCGLLVWYSGGSVVAQQ